MTTAGANKSNSFHWLPQFSLRQLMFLSGLFAFGMPAMLHASYLWANIILGLMFLLFTIAILSAVYCEGSLRAFWLGFAVFGWGFVAFTFYTLLTLNWGASGGTSLFDYMYDEVLDIPTREASSITVEPKFVTNRFPRAIQFNVQPNAGRARAISFQKFISVAHPFCGIFVAYLGGLVANVLFRRREHRCRINAQIDDHSDAS